MKAIAANRPTCDFEVVIADEGSTDPIVFMLKQFDFPITWIKVEMAEFEKKTGIKKYHNNPALTNNIAFKHCKGDYIMLQGNDIIACDDAYNKMLEYRKRIKGMATQIYCDTYNVYSKELQSLVNAGAVDRVRYFLKIKQAVLQGRNKQADVTNYLSLADRTVWENLNGYDERYVGGQACDDSDFARRARKFCGYAENLYAPAETLHQYHGNITHGITADSSLYTGLLANRKIFNDWDGDVKNKQEWPIGTYGIVEVIKL